MFFSGLCLHPATLFHNLEGSPRFGYFNRGRVGLITMNTREFGYLSGGNPCVNLDIARSFAAIAPELPEHIRTLLFFDETVSTVCRVLSTALRNKFRQFIQQASYHESRNEIGFGESHEFNRCHATRAMGSFTRLLVVRFPSPLAPELNTSRRLFGNDGGRKRFHLTCFRV